MKFCLALLSFCVAQSVGEYGHVRNENNHRHEQLAEQYGLLERFRKSIFAFEPHVYGAYNRPLDCEFPYCKNGHYVGYIPTPEPDYADMTKENVPACPHSHHSGIPCNGHEYHHHHNTHPPCSAYRTSHPPGK